MRVDRRRYGSNYDIHKTVFRLRVESKSDYRLCHMSTLRAQIDRLAAQFAGHIIDALRGASLDDLLAIAGAGGGRGRGRPPGSGGAAEPFGRRRGRGGRLGRRTADDIGRMIEGIVDLLQKNGSGMRAEQIRDALGVEAKELPRPLADALAAGRITKTGQKRATTYFAGGSGGGNASSRGGAKRGRKKSKG
jgi:hypothetical protein